MPDGATILDADSASESLHGTIWRRVDRGLRLQSGLVGELRAGAHKPAYRARSPCADYRAHWEYGRARLGCQADHRSPVKRPQPRKSTIKLRRAASGAGLCLHAAVRGLVTGRAFLPEGTFQAMDTPPPYFARRRSPVAGRLLFRDYLRNHPEVARAYAKLKRDLAAAFDDDISGYRNAKNAFVAATMAEARA